MDKILLNNMVFYGYHGVLQEEQILGQKFHVDVMLSLNLSQAGCTDNLDHTVNYADVYKLIEQVMQLERYQLMEAAAETIATRILHAFPLVQIIMVRIKKPHAPVAGIYDDFGVEIERERGKK